MDMNRMKAQLHLHESEKLKPYYDTVGKLTIGVGRNLTDVGISRDESDYLLTNDINEVLGFINAHFPWWKTLDEVRQRVIVDMTFNLGAKILQFQSFLKAVSDKRWHDASEHMLNSLWAQQVKTRATRLSEMMSSGEDYK